MPSSLQESAAALAGKNGHSLIRPDKFRQLFHALVGSQRLNEHLRSHGKPAAVPRSEAGPAGLVLDLRSEDTVLLPSPTHFAHRLKGIPLERILTQSATPSAAKLGSRFADAIAIAIENRLEKNGAIVLTLFHLDENSECTLSAYEEVFRIAEAGKLSILFVLESPAGFTDSAAFKQAHPNMPYIAVDAHDIVAVYRVAQESIVRTREGAGPAIIELAPFMTDGEDPVDKMHHYLRAKGLPASRWRIEAVRSFEVELRAACHLHSDPLASGQAVRDRLCARCESSPIPYRSRCE